MYKSTYIIAVCKAIAPQKFYSDLVIRVLMIIHLHFRRILHNIFKIQ